MQNDPMITQSWQDLYVDFMADPLDDRTTKQWCFDNKVDPSTVSRWKSKYRRDVFTEADRRRRAFIAEIRQTNWKRLMSRTEKDTKAVELVFKLLGDLVERSETNINLQKPDEKKTRLTELLAKAAAKEQAIEKFKAEVSDQGLPQGSSLGE